MSLNNHTQSPAAAGTGKITSQQVDQAVLPYTFNARAPVTELGSLTNSNSFIGETYIKEMLQIGSRFQNTIDAIKERHENRDAPRFLLDRTHNTELKDLLKQNRALIGLTTAIARHATEPESRLSFSRIGTSALT